MLLVASCYRNQDKLRSDIQTYLLVKASKFSRGCLPGTAITGSVFNHRKFHNCISSNSFYITRQRKNTTERYFAI